MDMQNTPPKVYSRLHALNVLVHSSGLLPTTNDNNLKQYYKRKLNYKVMIFFANTTYNTRKRPYH